MGYPISFVVVRYGANFLRSTHHWALGAATAYSIFGSGLSEGSSTPFLFICIVLILLVSALVYALHSRHLWEGADSASTKLTDADILEYAVFFNMITVFFLSARGGPGLL